MKALFVCTFPPETNLPPMDDSGDGYCLHYVEDGVTKGGYSCVGLVPQAPTCVVQVEVSAAVLTSMQADARYLFLEEVQDA